jgi:divalent metal cation (Fe/Co/Zn/Cd) transporter
MARGTASSVVGIALEVFTLSWITVEASVAVVAGFAASSVALIAFGLDSVIESVAAFVVLQTFRAEQAGRARHREQRALRGISVTFFLLAAYISVDAVYTLITASKPESSAAGMAVTAATLLVMPALSVAKRRKGSALGSQMLVADAAESLFCAYLSATGARRPSAQRCVRLVVGRPCRRARGRTARHQGRPRSPRRRRRISGLV